jgi:hypothetical protein
MAKQTMGKDDNGVFHPGKGKPSGVNKEESGTGIQATPPEKMDDYIDVTKEYFVDDDELQPAVPVRHPNRNTSKGEDRYKGENKEETNKSNNQTFTEEFTPVVAEQLPGVLTKERFAELANYKNSCCVSIFVGAHASGVEVNEHFDPINFKNQLQEASRRLAEKGKDQAFIEQLLKPGFDLIRDNDFWTELSPGFAVFIAEGFFKYIKMPIPPAEELLVIEPTFYVTPLISLMSSSEYFYLLVISKQGCKLFKADAWGMQKVPVELPANIEEVKRVSGLDATTYRSSESGRRAPAAAMPGSVHGGGGGNPDGKDNMLTYFEAVDDILWDKVFNKENAPLLLAGVEYEIPIYRSAADYHNVWPEALTGGNRQQQDFNSLYQDAKEMMKPYFEQRVTKALELYLNNSANGKTSSIAADVIPASYYSQVSHLFVCKGEHIWGTFDEMSNELSFHDTPDEDGEDLIDNAVVKTLANGGDVFLLDKEKMPAETQMAAIMRF